MRTYAKGSRVERELLEKFVERGFCVIRAAGSGVSSLSPDILAFKKGVQYAIEVKAWEKEHLNIKKEQFECLEKWERLTGITTYIVWRRRRRSFLFIPLSVFEKGKKAASVSYKFAEQMGMKEHEIFGP